MCSFGATPGQYGSFSVVRDGHEGRRFGFFHRAVSRPQFHLAPQGEVAFAAPDQEGKWRVVVNDRERPEQYDDLKLARFGSTRPVFVATLLARGPGAAREQFVLIPAGRELPRYPAVGDVTTSDDGAHLAYVGGASDGTVRVVIDGRPTGPYDAAMNLVFSPEGDRFAFAARRGSAEHVTVDGSEGPPFDTVGLIYFSRKGDHLAYVAGAHGREFVVVDGIPGEYYDHVRTIRFLPGGDVAYLAEEQGHPLLVRGSSEHPTCNAPQGLEVSPEGGTIAVLCCGHGGSQFRCALALNGRLGREFPMIGRVRFSPDGAHCAYLARWMEHRDDGFTTARAAVVLNGVVLAAHRDVDLEPGFTEGYRFEYLAIDGSVVSRVVVAP
jgi:hypothetical protein